MNILIVGEQAQQEEAMEKFGSLHNYTRVTTAHEAEKLLSSNDVVFDFCNEVSYISAYFTGLPVFLNSTKRSLQEFVYRTEKKTQNPLFGFNGLPGFLNRELFEVSLLRLSDKELLNTLCRQLSTNYVVVEDQVGLVTSRIVCMIINEAYFAVQDGTASREDIDTAMKLGTNYPYGPFEWCRKIGVQQVYELLQAVYNDTKDERYKICSLLKKEYLSNTLVA